MYTYITIDDEALIRKGIQKRLDDLHEILRCVGEGEHGKECIELVDKLKPDIILLDMNMPFMNGAELLPYLAANYPEIQLIVISGYRDFDYVMHAMNAQAVNYILKPFDKKTLQNAILQAIDNIKSKIYTNNEIITIQAQKEKACYEYDILLLKHLLVNNKTTYNDFTSQHIRTLIEAHNFYLATLSFDSEMDSSFDFQDFLTNHNHGDLTLYLNTEKYPQLGFLILFIPKQSNSDSVEYITEILDTANMWLYQKNISYFIGISKQHDNLLNLQLAFKECIFALDSRSPIADNTSLAFYSGIPAPKFIEWKDSARLLFYIELGATNEVVRLSKELFIYLKSVPNCNLADVKYCCHQLYENCRIIINTYFNHNTISKDYYTSSISSSVFSISMLEIQYTTFFVNISKSLLNNSIYAIDDVVEKVKIYVQHNYQKSLNMEFISSLFYMNRSYLSHLFKKKTGNNFVDYVNQIRIDKARDLLLTSDKKMYQISKQIGYDNVKYFFKIFKKTTGMSPSEFQTKHKT